MSEEAIEKAKNYNIKLYPIYKMFSWDLLFYYSIIYLFLLEIKNLSASSILLGDAFYPLTKALFQTPAIVIVERIGKRNSIILGNFLLALSMVILLIFKGIFCAILFNIVLASGFILKGLCESSVLDECIVDKEKKRSIFSKLEGKGNSFWYFFDAISAVSTGFLFILNPYLPIYVCLSLCIISTILAYKFKPYENVTFNFKKRHEFKNVIRDFKQLRSAFRTIFKSNRLKCILIFAGIFHGILGIRTTLTSSLLADIGLPEQYFGIISAILSICASVSSKHQSLFHNQFKNKTLTYLSLPYCFTLILSGFIVSSKLSFDYVLIILIVLFGIQNIIKGPYYTLIFRYLNSFSSPEASTKIYSAHTYLEGVLRFIITLFASFLLNITNTANSLIILGCVFTFILILLLDYMRTRVGLKPEEYKKSDIHFTFVK